jgi:hypothetical protein
MGVSSQLVSASYDTGPEGEKSPRRVLAKIIGVGKPPGDQPLNGNAFQVSPPERLPVEASAAVIPATSRARRLYLSEDRQDLMDPTSMPKYFITEEGREPKAFDMMSDKPEITVGQGTVEDWVIENRAREAHTFHIHQLHFQVLERDGRATEPIMMDTIDVPYWDGKGAYPSVKLRMDFRSPAITGTFVYHCHILEHEDNGMMGRIRVVHEQ